MAEDRSPLHHQTLAAMKRAKRRQRFMAALKEAKLSVEIVKCVERKTPKPTTLIIQSR